MQAHQIRSLVYEFGVITPLGWRTLLSQTGSYCAMMTGVAQCRRYYARSSSNNWRGLHVLTERIEALERRIAGWQRRETECRGIGAIMIAARIAEAQRNGAR